MKKLILLVAGLSLTVVGGISAQITVSNTPVADTFTRSADPTHNYGGAGALSVSGLIATNGSGVQQGALDSFARFDVSGLVSTFNSNLGTGNWVISSASLKLTETASPPQAIFNRGAGQFEVRWIANDTWVEGTGNPASPTTNGLTWNDEPSVLNSNLDVSLGFFSNAGVDGQKTYALGTPSAFLSDIGSGGLVSLYFTAPANSTIGFTFNSRSFGTVSAQPYLVLTAVAVPEPSVAVLVGFSLAGLTMCVRQRKNGRHASAT